MTIMTVASCALHPRARRGALTMIGGALKLIVMIVMRDQR